MNLKKVLQLSSEYAIPYLLGATIISRIGGVETGGIITELEAYLAVGDQAAHNSKGKTRANQSLFAEAGTLYIHTMRQYTLMDIVTEGIGVPSSVLIRAFHPTVGFDEMKRRRNEDFLQKLANGPGKVCQALGITRKFDGVSLFDSADLIEITLPKTPVKEDDISISHRVGITKNADAPLRFLLRL